VYAPRDLRSPGLAPGFTQAEFDDLVDRHMESGGQPGLAYGVVRDGRLVHSGGRGRRWLAEGAAGSAAGPVPDEKTVFRIASMTKSFTAAIVLLLRDEGALRLDDEITKYVPEATALRGPTDDAPPLTIRALLTMTAGLPTDDPWGDRQQDLPDDAFAGLLRAGLSFAWTPGTAYEYSNTGYALLGRVISAAAGEPYADAVTRRLLAPLGLRSTVFTAAEVPPDRLALGYRSAPGGGWEEVPFAGHGAFASMGGLFSTLEDLATWVGGFTGAYPPRDGADDGPGARPGGTHPLGRASRREQQQPHRALPPAVSWSSLAEPPLVRGQAYGFGLIVEQDQVLGDLVSHGGGYPGFGTHMRWHPASGYGVVVLSNATYAPAARLSGQLLDLILMTGPANPLRSAPVPRLADPAPGKTATGMTATGMTATGMTAAAEAAQAGVNRLIEGWDDELAAGLLAPNVDADEPLERRRAAIERIRADLGPLEPDPADAWSSSPAHRVWWLRGPGGRARVEIRLSPQLPPQVQTLSVTAVRHPPTEILALAELIARALGTDAPAWPEGWRLPPDDEGEVDRSLRVASAWAGACRVGAVISGDGACQVTFRLEGGSMALALALSWEPGTRHLTAVSLRPL
jgi:serine-type D-Ala-D-Ala carboxypeptidase/endopeptidase